MIDRRKKQKAFIRTNKQGQLAPASLMYRDKAPTGAKFKQLINPSPDLCCGGDQGCGGSYLIDVTYGTSYSDRLYNIYTDIDDQCNTYALYFRVEPTGEPVPEEEGNSWYGITKQSKDGTIIWQKQINSIYYSNGWFEPYLLYVNNPTGRIILIGENGVMAIDFDGNELWFKAFDYTGASGTLSNFYISTGYVSPDGASVYVGGRYSDVSGNLVYILKLDASTGDVVKQIKNAYVTEGGVFVSDLYGLIGDEAGNAIAPLTVYNPAIGYEIYMFKFDPDLNETWKVNVAPAGTAVGWDTPAADYAGNIYMYANWYNVPEYNIDGVIKLDAATGDLLWFGSLYKNNPPITEGSVWTGDLRFDTDNNLYAIFDIPKSYDPYQKTINVVKIKSDASGVDFAYEFYDTTIEGIYSYYYNSTHSGPNLANGNIIYSAYYYGGYSGWMFKLPLTPVSGTYGNIQFNPLTNYTWTTSTPSVGPATIWSFSPSTDLAPYWLPYSAGLADAPGPVPTVLSI